MSRPRTLTPSASPMHFFGSEARRAREAAGMSQSDLGALVPCDKATVSRVEAGLTMPDEAFAVACDAAFPRMDGWFTRFYADSRGWGEAFPPAFREFATCEAEAVALRWFEHSLVPGLLQSEDYARAVLDRHPNTTGAQVQERLVARLARQETLERENPPLVWILLDENVLHREVGGAKIMHDQLCRLADMARRPNVTVQVISRVGAHPGLSGAFGIAELSDRHTVAYLETAADGQTVEDPATVAAVELRFDALRTEAFRGTESLVLIENEADKWNP
ncbi:MAG TPA: helix-turn-helix transcriptional regulator [Trebonia sp.]|nr:helix-turn-helix transcriptional regulator [Trebonia sp.]